MDIVVRRDGVKIFNAKFGHNELFGIDTVKRQQKMSDEERIALFDSVWERCLKRLIVNGEAISSDEVLGLLDKKKHGSVDPNQEHRRFRTETQSQAIHIAQLRPVDNDLMELTMLWHVHSTNPDALTVYVKLATLETKRDFDQAALEHGMDGREMGEKLLIDWLEKQTHKTYERLYERRRQPPER